MGLKVHRLGGDAPLIFVQGDKMTGFSGEPLAAFTVSTAILAPSDEISP